VLDTLAHVFGGNENVRPQVTTFVNGCLQHLANAIGGAVIVCAHPSRAGLMDGSGLSGSTAWEGSVRSRWYLGKPENGGQNDRVLSRKKANYASSGEDEDLALRWSEGVLQPIGDVTHSDRPAAGSVFLDLLYDLRNQGRHVSEKDRANNYAPTVMAGMSGSWGYNSGQFAKAMEQLFQSGRIKVGTYKSGNRHSREGIIIVGE
jgi:RecA-family ATPase